MTSETTLKSHSSSSLKKLEEVGILPTPVRILVLNCIIEATSPVSLTDIQYSLETVDKSSISRALNLFKSKHLVHFFDDGSGSVKYEICDHPEHKEANDSHVHFHCLKCGETFCLHNIKIPDITLPEGFSQESATFILKGYCKSCKRK